MRAVELETLLIETIGSSEIKSQSDLQTAIMSKGTQVTQSSLSRALSKLNISKVDGVYKLPLISKGESDFFDFLEIHSSGDSMLVAKTSPGSASRVAFKLDNTQIPGLVGTVAGDDTIFIALSNSSFRTNVTSSVIKLFKN